MLFTGSGYYSSLFFQRGLRSFVIIGIFQLCLLNKTQANLPSNKSSLKGSLELSPEASVSKKLQIRNFTEFMTPALRGKSSSIPNSDGSEFIPTALFNIFTADYEIAPNYRILYYQRVFLLLSSSATLQGGSIFGRDPRFALRRSQVFDVPNLNTAIDLYFQPGVSNNQISGGNNFEVGFRTNAAYAPPGTRWGFGMIQEFTSGYLDASGSGQRAYGWFMPWVSYDLSQRFSLQHYSNLAFKNPRNLSWTEFQWDDQPPFMQNGLNFSLTKSVTTSLFLNNYLRVKPTLSNTWASLWLSITFL